jgi:Flp pilus assembly protein TadD
LKDLTDLVQLIKELGPVWGPLAVFLGLLMWRVRHRWNYEGARGGELFWDRWVLSIFLVGIVYSPAYYYYRYRYWGLPPSFEKGEIGILIGEIPGDTNQQQQAAYAREIRALVRKTPELEAIVKVKMLERPLPADPQEQQAKALQWGRWLRATFVLRPNVVEGVQEPWITVIDQGGFSTVEGPMGKFPSAQLAKLDQLPLPSNLLLLARCALALAFYRQGSYGHVAGELQDVLAAPGLPEPAPARSYLTLAYANALYFLRKNDEAITQFKKSIALNPDFAESHNNLGVALHEKGDQNGAMAEWREALRLKPAFAEAHANLGNAFRDKHDLDGAMAEDREALRLKPDLAEAHNNLGGALHEKGDQNGAMAEWREALRLKPDLADAHNNLGNAFRGKHNLDGAMAEYREALRLKPDGAEAHNNLGVALHE